MESSFDWMSFATGFVGALALVLLLRFRANKRVRADLTPTPSMPVIIPPKLQAQVRLMKAEGRTVEAVKIVRKATGCDLKAAKEAVEKLR